jgi:hypothetical protein
MFNVLQSDETLRGIFSKEPGYLQKCFKVSAKDPLNRYLDHVSRKPTAHVERYRLIRPAWEHYRGWLKSEGRLERLADVDEESQVKAALGVLKQNGF